MMAAAAAPPGEVEPSRIRLPKGVQLAELGLQSWAQRKWLPVPKI